MRRFCVKCAPYQHRSVCWWRHSDDENAKQCWKIWPATEVYNKLPPPHFCSSHPHTTMYVDMCKSVADVCDYTYIFVYIYVHYRYRGRRFCYDDANFMSATGNLMLFQKHWFYVYVFSDLFNQRPPPERKRTHSPRNASFRQWQRFLPWNNQSIHYRNWHLHEADTNRIVLLGVLCICLCCTERPHGCGFVCISCISVFVDRVLMNDMHAWYIFIMIPHVWLLGKSDTNNS